MKTPTSLVPYRPNRLLPLASNRSLAHALTPVLALGLLMGPCLVRGGEFEAPVIREVTRTPEGLLLQWSGGTPPFVIQSSSELSTWKTLATTAETAFTIEMDGSPQAFFRIEGMSEPNLGRRLGEWRVAEGEFGDPLASHRLKSVWEFYLPESEPADTARDLFTKATVRLRYLEGQEVVTFIGRLQDLPGATLTEEEMELNVTWTWGEGEWKRDLKLNLEFRYPVTEVRSQPVNLSDPSIMFRADYEVAKPNVDRGGEVGVTLSDEVGLAQLADDDPSPEWWQRAMKFSGAGVTIDSRFEIGVPYIEGELPFVFKTPLLLRWESTTVTGLTEQPIVLTGRFSQTYLPSHHNFVETLYLDPAQEPGMDPAILQELQEKNIRFIIPVNPSAFPEREPSLHVLGFDGELRTLHGEPLGPSGPRPL